MLRKVRPTLRKLLPTAVLISREHYQAHGKLPNLVRPQTFNEKVQWRKLYDRDPRLRVYSDKIAAKQLACSRLGPEWIVPTLWTGERPQDIPFETLAPPYVIKTNHGSGMITLVRSAADVVPDAIVSQLTDWLSRDYSLDHFEWAYHGIPPRILVEPMINVGGRIPADLKVWVFDGKARFLQLHVDRFDSHMHAFFDRDWRVQPFTMNPTVPPPPPGVPRPEHLPEILAAAEELAEGFSFARVDFYDLPSGPKFGEFTFYPGAGLVPFSPEDSDRMIGSFWKIRSRKRRSL
jgi:hypothetical protein